MNSSHLQTQRLDLTLPSVEQALAAIDAMSPEEKSYLSKEWLELVHNAKEPDPWIHGYSMTSRDDKSAVGQCGFKGPPDSEGMVEIAYAVDPSFQGQGYATEAATALVEYAFSREDVRLVRAHTLPESNASTRVLNKCGFEKLGEVVDPEDGLIWRWQMESPAA